MSPKKTIVETIAISRERAPSAPSPSRGPRVARAGGTDPDGWERAPSGSMLLEAGGRSGLVDRCGDVVRELFL